MSAAHHLLPAQRARLRAHKIRESALVQPAEIARARRWIQKHHVMAIRLADAPALARAANAEAGRCLFSPDALVQVVTLDGWLDGRGDPAFKPLIEHYRKKFNIRTPPGTESDPPR